MFRPLIAYASVSFVMLQVLGIVFPALHIPEWVMSLLVILIILGFPITFVLAWVYDITPDGIINTSSKKKKYSESHKESYKPNKILFPVTGMLTIIGVGFWVWYSLVGVSRGSEINLQEGIKKSIAILNFENHTGNSKGAYFCSALAETIF